MLALEPLLSVRSWPLRRRVAASAGAVAVAFVTGAPAGTVQPIRPLVGFASVGLLAVGLVLRLRGASWCRVPAR